MLGGLDPVIIFQFKSLAPTVGATIARIPIISKDSSFITMPPIPVYLSEKIFNLVIGGTSKSIDIETDTQTLTSGLPADVNQKGIQSSVEVHIEGKQDSIALTLLSAMIDQIFDKASSKEYSISFLYGATTIFNALLQSYSVETIEGTDRLSIKIKLSRGSKHPNPVPGVPGAQAPIAVGATP